MEKLPTAEEFLWNGSIITQGDTEPYGKLPNDKIPLVMIEFAKMHVTAALKEVINNAEIDDYDVHGQYSPSINEDSILNAYPLDKIK